MDIAKRIQEAEQKFNKLQDQKNQHIKDADDCQTEMTKLMGEWRLLQELLESKGKKPNKKANVIEAEPEQPSEKAG